MYSTLVDIQALRKRYGDFQAVADLSLQVRRGEIFALLGSNGARCSASVKCRCPVDVVPMHVSHATDTDLARAQYVIPAVR